MGHRAGGWLFHFWCVCVHTVIMSILQAVLRYQKWSRARCWTSLGAIVQYNSCMCLCIHHIAHTRSHTHEHTHACHIFVTMYSCNLSIKTQTKEVEEIFVFADFFAQYTWLNLSLSLALLALPPFPSQCHRGASLWVPGLHFFPCFLDNHCRSSHACWDWRRSYLSNFVFSLLDYLIFVDVCVCVCVCACVCACVCVCWEGALCSS